MMNKKAFAPVLLLIVGLLIVAGIYAGYVSTGSIIGSGSYIERPVFKYVKCEATSGFKYSIEFDLAQNGEWLFKPSVASSYNVVFKANSLAAISSNRFLYSVCNSQVNSKDNCRIFNQGIDITSTGQRTEVTGIKNNEVVFAQYQKLNPLTFMKWVGQSGAKYQIGYVPYGLREYDVLSGSSTQLTANDCETPLTSSSWTDRFLSSDSSKINAKITSRSVNERVLQPEEVRWYISGYVTSAEPSFALTYKGASAWCRTTGKTAEIYRINTVTVASGTYKIASPDYSDYLGSVTCCPGQTMADAVCQSDFTWKSIVQSECGAFKSCGSADWAPYAEKTLIKYSCVSGKCQSQTKKVDCANDYDCKDSNAVCDLNSYTCVNANVNLDGQVIKTIPDNAADCASKGGTWMKSSTTEKSWYNYLGIGSPKVIVNEYCKMPASWTELLAKAVIYIIIIAIALIAFKFLRPVLKSIPYVRRFIP
jgi:hypothetical protein